MAPAKMDVARVCFWTLAFFWALPLVVGMWLGWGNTLVFTTWDALFLSAMLCYFGVEFGLLARRIFFGTKQDL